eukprot:scaffold128884_cov18-Tisochrysis_lutea.AAC.1
MQPIPFPFPKEGFQMGNTMKALKMKLECRMAENIDLIPSPPIRHLFFVLQKSLFAGEHRLEHEH